MSSALVLVLATAWSVSLSVAGLGLMTVIPAQLGLLERFPGLRGPAWLLGVTLLASGHLVFVFFVADRLFPSAVRGLVWWSEVLACIIVIGGSAWLMGRIALWLLGAPVA
ncbi:MAG: hypothetical protein RBS39_13910 [Phycisphaerales bacterium]|nr:hypothetical protein [Phycisphaerales bacterium]